MKSTRRATPAGRRATVTAALWALALALLVGGCGSPSAEDCARDVYRQYTEAELRWQLAVHDHVAGQGGPYVALLNDSRELQRALAEQGRKRLDYLLEHRPERIPFDRGLTALVEFQKTWTEADSRALRETDPEYAALEDRVRALTTQGEQDPQWPALRALFREAVQNQSALQEKRAAFTDVLQSLESLLTGCHNLRLASR